MYRTFQRYFRFFAVALSALLSSEEWEYGRNDTCCVNDFQFRISLLILKPSMDQQSYAISSTDNRFGGEVYPNGERHFVNANFKPGVRVETLCPIWPCPSNILNLRFAYFKAHDSSDTSGPFQFDTVGYPGHGAQSPEDVTYNGTARMRHHYLYYGADATLNRPLFEDCCDNLTFLFGVHFSYIKFCEKFLSTGTFLSDGTQILSNDFRLKSRFWALGPEIGIDYNYILPCFRACGDIGINVNFRGMILASGNDAEVHAVTNRTGPVGVNVKNKGMIYRVNPAINTQVGLSYSCCACGYNTFVELGYELMWYSKSINKVTSYDVAFAGDTWDAFEDLCLQGPFLRINVSF